MARLATEADLQAIVDGWNEVVPIIAPHWPGGMTAWTLETAQAYFRAGRFLVRANGFFYIQRADPDPRHVVLPLPGSQLLFWIVRPGLTRTQYRTILKDLFSEWFALCRAEGTHAWGELPARVFNRIAGSVEFLRNANFPEVSVQRTGEGWVIWYPDPVRDQAGVDNA